MFPHSHPSCQVITVNVRRSSSGSVAHCALLQSVVSIGDCTTDWTVIGSALHRVTFPDMLRQNETKASLWHQNKTCPDTALWFLFLAFEAVAPCHCVMEIQCECKRFHIQQIFNLISALFSLKISPPSSLSHFCFSLHTEGRRRSSHLLSCSTFNVMSEQLDKAGGLH